ncbi:hypothetical protein [Bacillus sp. FJAT-22090]|uniref:hypothetical protein n=1 Tax=Bacillus sp. FJAT-22090 TaxID=1581038 RepID=UPI00119D528F|nr:hypothetical protein [Bacillus sp. FJAT-22090]
MAKRDQLSLESNQFNSQRNQFELESNQIGNERNQFSTQMLEDTNYYALSKKNLLNLNGLDRPLKFTQHLGQIELLCSYATSLWPHSNILCSERKQLIFFDFLFRRRLLPDEWLIAHQVESVRKKRKS